MATIDIKAIPSEGQLFDVGIDENGDFVQEDGFDTALFISIYAEKRANENEQPLPNLRRGWIGNLFSEVQDYEIGSKLWLLDQSRRTDLTLTRASQYTDKALAWLKEQNHADKVQTDSEFIEDGIRIFSKVFRKNDLVNSKTYDLWENTGK